MEKGFNTSLLEKVPVLILLGILAGCDRWSGYWLDPDEKPRPPPPLEGNQHL